MAARPLSRLRPLVPLAAGLLLLALAQAPPAGAHSFLVRSSPQAGSRLPASPRELTLFFSEPFVGGSERISLRRFHGEPLALPRPSGRGTVVRQPLPPRLRGIYVVTWRVLSDDGHLSTGEFALAVRAAGALPALPATRARAPWSQIAVSWLFFAGLALALGGLASEALVWRRTPDLGSSRALVAPGVALAALAALAQLVLLAGNRAGGGFGSGLRDGALQRALPTRPGELTLAVLSALFLASVLLLWPRLRPLALLPLLAAVVATSLRGHSGTSGHGWAIAADVVHLAAAAAWAGALAHLVLVVARVGRGEALPTVVAGARRYARLALPTVALLAASGVGTALAQFRSVDDLLGSGYGQTLLVKAGLVGLALALALAARRRALPSNPGARVGLLRRLTAGEITAVTGVLVAVSLLVNLAPPRSSRAALRLPELGPPPLAGGAVRLADLAGQLVVGLAATERELQFAIVRPGNEPAEGARIAVAAASGRARLAADLYPRPCGAGCFTIRFRLPAGRTTIVASVSAPGWRGGEARFRVPRPLPPEQPAILRRVARTMAAVPSLTLSEAVSSGPGASTGPTGYTLSGKQLIANELYRGGAVDVRPIERTGRLTELAFALPGSNVWYRMTIDRSYRVLRETIVSPGHLIRRRFAYPGRARAARSSSSAKSPRPPTGVFALGREADDLAVGLAARQAGRRLVLTATVLEGDGAGAGGLDVAVLVRAGGGSISAAARPCGRGCYRASPVIEGKPELVLLRLARVGRPPALLRFALPARWPPPSATALVRQATRVFRHLESLVIEERIASSSRNVVRDTWQLVAPNRATYRIVGGGESVIIGGRRFDRDPGGRWQVSSQSPLAVPWVPWGTPPAKAWLLGSSRVGARPVWLVSFVDPGAPAWLTLAIEKETLRTLELRLVAPAHFMHHRYTDFNRTLTIAPPRTARVRSGG